MEWNIIWGSTRFNLRAFIVQYFHMQHVLFSRRLWYRQLCGRLYPYNADKNIEFVVNNLDHSLTILFKWLNGNCMKLNTGKSYLLISGNVRATAKIDSNYVGSYFWKPYNINNICKRASQKLNALARVAPYMNMQKRKIIMKSFVTSQFGYRPLIWMFHSRHLSNKINSIHEGALRITYQDHISTFQEQLNKGNSVSIHHRNLQALATEMFKIHRNLPPDILR